MNNKLLFRVSLVKAANNWQQSNAPQLMAQGATGVKTPAVKANSGFGAGLKRLRQSLPAIIPGSLKQSFCKSGSTTELSNRGMLKLAMFDIFIKSADGPLRSQYQAGLERHGLTNPMLPLPKGQIHVKQTEDFGEMIRKKLNDGNPKAIITPEQQRALGSWMSTPPVASKMPTLSNLSGVGGSTQSIQPSPLPKPKTTASGKMPTLSNLSGVGGSTQSIQPAQSLNPINRGLARRPSGVWGKALENLVRGKNLLRRGIRKNPLLAVGGTALGLGGVNELVVNPRRQATTAARTADGFLQGMEQKYQGLNPIMRMLANYGGFNPNAAASEIYQNLGSVNAGMFADPAKRFAQIYQDRHNYS
jgi:hypothetical protein